MRTSGGPGGARTGRRTVLLLAPAAGVIVILFAGGLALAFAESTGLYAGAEGFTLEHYRALWFDGEFRVALGFSILVATVATIISAVLGLGLAVALRELARASRIFQSLLQAPLAVPHLAMAVALIHILAPSGLIARLGHAAGWIEAPAEFPQLLNDGYGLGIILAYVLKEAPFIALMTLALLVRLGDEYEAAARTLGASAWQRLRHVTLPMAAPAVVSASLVVFAFVFGAFEVPYLMGRPYPAMLAVVAQRRFMSMELADRPAAIAVALVMATVTALLVWVYMRLTRILLGMERPAIL